MEPAGLTIAEAASSTGLTADTLRYYERDGLLLHPVPRGPSGHRRYGDPVRAGDGNEGERLDRSMPSSA